jgi:hypothetical protein
MTTKEFRAESPDIQLPKGASNINVTANMLIYPAVILHPSLGCPLIVDDKGPVSLLIVTDSTFRDAFIEGNGGNRGKNATGGLNVATSICQHLKVVAWDQARELKQDLSRQDKTIEVAKNDIVCTYLGKLDREIINAEGKHIANVRQSVLNQFRDYRENGEDPGLFAKYFSNNGLRYLFQIDLNKMKLKPGALYDSYWVLNNLAPQKADIHKKYLDIQDRAAREYIQEKYYQYAQKEGPEYAFKVGGQGVEMTPDTNTPIQTHHPIWVVPSGKDTLTIGHLSDVHVSSKQAAYKGREATVIPGADVLVSPHIGNMANNNADNFFDLLNEFGNTSDVVIITGDLYDHLHNYDPTFKRTASTSKPGSTGELWEAMYVEDVKSVQARNEEFPCGIDGLIVYSILMDFYTRHKKPVFIVSGNHEAYEYPYGISPRVLKKRANEGIPSDHNLTIYEAILLYGPAYKLLVPSSKAGGFATFTGGLLGRMNFKAQNFDWFYNLLTPLTDYWQSYKLQTIIGLGWGDGEDYLWNPTPVSGLDEGGFLPRSTESVDAAQKSLVETALRQNCRDNIFCSHFTVVNYALGTPLTTPGEVQAVDNGYSKFEHGTVKSGRHDLHGDWIGGNRFSLTLSGHSHRSGLYNCEFVPSRKIQRGPYSQFESPDSWEYIPAFLKTRGHYPESEEAKALCWDKKTKVLVSASTGPVSKQNREGEMAGWGMEPPSGSRMAADGTIALVKSGRANAQPRFCVACDYIDLVGEGFWEHFKVVSGNTFELKPYWEKIHPKLSQEVKEFLIKSVTLCFVGENPIMGAATLNGNIVEVAFPSSSNIIKTIKKDYSKGAIFLSINFNGENLKNAHQGFEDYDYNSPWNIQVGIYDGRGNDIDFSKPGLSTSQWQIMRHKRFGEVPSFRFRKDRYNSEYNTILELDQ